MQNTAHEMRISDWSSDVCSSDLIGTDIRNSSVLPLELTLGYLGGYDAAIAGIGERTGYQKWITPDCFQFVIGKISGIVTDNLLHEFGTHVLVEEDCRFVGILLNPGIEHIAFCRSEEQTSELQSLMRISYA